MRRLAGKVIRDFFLNPDHKFGIFPEAFIIRKVVNKLAVEEEGLLIAVGMRIQTKFGLTGITERHNGLDGAKAPAGIVILEFGGQNLGLQGGCLVRVLALNTIYAPDEVVAVKTPVPILILDVINAVRGNYNGVIFPVFDGALGRLAGVFTIGDNQVVIRQLHIQKVQQTLFPCVHRTISEMCLDDFCHIMCVIILLVVPLLNLFFDKGNGLKFHLGGLSPTLSMLFSKRGNLFHLCFLEDRDGNN